MSMETPPSANPRSADLARRRLLAALGAGGALALSGGAVLYAMPDAQNEAFPGERAAGQPVNASVRWGMLVEADKCTGCGACVEACRQQNGLPVSNHPEDDPQWIRIVHLRDKRTGRQHQAPVMCQHCADAPCVDVCPTGASFRRADGIVMVDKHICIGCRYCMMACPYKARSFIAYPIEHHVVANPSGMGCVESCNLCAYRMDEQHIHGINGTTACAAACQREGHDVLLYGDLNDADSPLSRRLVAIGAHAIRPDLATDPGVLYHGI